MDPTLIVLAVAGVVVVLAGVSAMLAGWYLWRSDRTCPDCGEAGLQWKDSGPLPNQAWRGVRVQDCTYCGYRGELVSYRVRWRPTREELRRARREQGLLFWLLAGGDDDDGIDLTDLFR